MKLNTERIRNLIGEAFNWTKVELKHMLRYYDMLGISAFNWTKVELKPEWAWLKDRRLCLLIELR